MLKKYGFIEYLPKLDKFPIQSPTLHWLISRVEIEKNHNPNKRTLKFTIARHSVKKPRVANLHVGTFPFAIQAWVLECVSPNFAASLAKRLSDNPLPIIYRWDNSHISPGSHGLASQLIYETKELDNKPTHQGYHMPGREDDDENVLGFLNLTLVLKKLARKVHRPEERVICLEKERLNVNKEEGNLEVHPTGNRRPGPAVVSPYLKVEPIKKTRKTILLIPNPYDPANDFAFNTSKYIALRRMKVLQGNKLLDRLGYGWRSGIVGGHGHWFFQVCAGSHWATYAYDFQEKQVRIYDSMSSAYNTERRGVWVMHTALAPSLFNEGVKKEEDKMDLDILFVLNVLEVSQYTLNKFDSIHTTVPTVGLMWNINNIHNKWDVWVHFVFLLFNTLVE
ncbi:hypothetical protein LIER_32524 [Lithospermum erythrorhizon]|uniref:Uncharacterized protein n=1 Tax=Lithospermum erythrorhizon TaxID=34254 RepID=A0AAV3RZF3_LITER